MTHDEPTRPVPRDALPEGEEAPPPGVRTMAAIRWALVALAALAAAGTWLHWASASPHAAHAGASYRCPMHPTIAQGSPGACPVCGMDLVAGAAPQPAPPPAGATAAAGKYWCPMHPEVASDDPSARCEKCGGMKLLPRGGGAAAAPPGLAVVDVGAERARLVGVRTAAVRRERLRPALRAPASVTVREGAVALVSSRVTGWIEKLHVAEAGARVAKGQVLATIASPELVTAQQVHLSSVAARGQQPSGLPLSVDPTRRLELLGIAPQDVEELERTKQVLPALPIRAPAAGFVARKAAQQGLYVQPGLELYQIADLSTVWVVAEVPEREARRVRPGLAARVRLAGLPGEELEGRVDRVYPAVSPETRTLAVRIPLSSPAGKVLPGMTGEAILALDDPEALAVPADAVVDTGELQYVFVATAPGRFEPRTVRLGARDGDRVEVVEGVAAGEQVVTGAGFLVDSESRLRAAVQGLDAGQR